MWILGQQAEADVQQERECEREWLRMQARSDRLFLETLRRDCVRLFCKQSMSWVQVWYMCVCVCVCIHIFI